MVAINSASSTCTRARKAKIVKQQESVDMFGEESDTVDGDDNADDGSADDFIK